MTNAKKPRIVWVEDDQFLWIHFEAALHAWFKNPEIVFFANGDEAWDNICVRDPDLFITDFAHPGLDGVELLKRVAARNVQYPVVFATGFLGKFATKEIEALGLNLTIIVKPFTREDFWSKVCLPLGPCENGDTIASFNRWQRENSERLKSAVQSSRISVIDERNKGRLGST